MSVTSRPPGSTKRNLTLSYSALLDDRIRVIAKRLNMPVRDVLVKLIVIGLDSSQDLKLMEPVSKGLS